MNVIHALLESADKCRENGKDEPKNIICEIFYVVFVRMPGEDIRRLESRMIQVLWKSESLVFFKVERRLSRR